MKYRVKNTIDNSTEEFATIEQANEYIDSEIRWWNSQRENKKGNGYTKDDFQIRITT